MNIKKRKELTMRGDLYESVKVFVGVFIEEVEDDVNKWINDHRASFFIQSIDHSITRDTDTEYIVSVIVHYYEY
jgi:hypothetical protein